MPAKWLESLAERALTRLAGRKDFIMGDGFDSFGEERNLWWPVVGEPFTGAWQRNIALSAESILAFHAVYACIERIASDVAKCRLRLVEEDANGIWNEIDVPAFSPVIRKPNHYQTRIQFFEDWITSKLLTGNTYVLKSRDNRNLVTALYILNPRFVQVLTAPDGTVLYQLSKDNVTGIEDTMVVPADEIIHDMTTVRHHPLCGLSPMAPASLAAIHGINIQKTQTRFFSKAARPSGILTGPGTITEANAKKLKAVWRDAFRGPNAGDVAVMGMGLKFEPMTMTAVDAQLIEQLQISAKMVCSSFGVPWHMVGVGDPPNYNNIEALNQQYYSQCLQKYFEAIELLLDEGLGLVDVVGKTYGTWFDLDDLLRMDTAALYDAETKAVGGGYKAPNESRKRLNLEPVEGGATPYLQQQNYSLSALNKRDTQADPFAPKLPPQLPAPPQPDQPKPAQQQVSFDPVQLDVARHIFRAQVETLAAAS